MDGRASPADRTLNDDEQNILKVLYEFQFDPPNLNSKGVPPPFQWVPEPFVGAIFGDHYLRFMAIRDRLIKMGLVELHRCGIHLVPNITSVDRTAFNYKLHDGRTLFVKRKNPQPSDPWGGDQNMEFEFRFDTGEPLRTGNFQHGLELTDAGFGVARRLYTLGDKPAPDSTEAEQDDDAAYLQIARDAIRRVSGGADAKPDAVLKVAKGNRQRLRKALRRLETEKEYRGFQKPIPLKYRSEGSSVPER